MLDLFFGCVLVAFGPAAVFLALVVVPHSHMAVLSTTAAFFQLVALLFTSLFHLLNLPLLTLCMGVLLQELARFALVKLYFRVEQTLLENSNLSELPWSLFSAATGVGFGFGAMNSLIVYGAILPESIGRADYYSETCGSGISVFLIGALAALGMQCAHVAWTVLLFARARQGRRIAVWLACVFCLHILTSLAAMLNAWDQVSPHACDLGLPLQYSVVVASVLLAARSVQW